MKDKPNKVPTEAKERMANAAAQEIPEHTTEDAWALLSEQTRMDLDTLDRNSQLEILETMAALGTAVGRLGKPSAVRINIEYGADEQWSGVAYLYGESVGAPSKAANMHHVLLGVVSTLALQAAQPDDAATIEDQSAVLRLWGAALMGTGDVLQGEALNRERAALKQLAKHWADSAQAWLDLRAEVDKMAKQTEQGLNPVSLQAPVVETDKKA